MISRHNYFESLASEARYYARGEGMVIATREEINLFDGRRTMFVARLMRRMGDTLYETGGMGETEDEAVALAYRAWLNYWRKPGAEPI